MSESGCMLSWGRGRGRRSSGAGWAVDVEAMRLGGGLLERSQALPLVFRQLRRVERIVLGRAKLVVQRPSSFLHLAYVVVAELCDASESLEDAVGCPLLNLVDKSLRELVWLHLIGGGNT